MSDNNSDERRERPRMGEWRITTNEAEKHRKDLQEKNRSHKVEWGYKIRGWDTKPVRAMYIGYRIKREGIYWETGYSEDWERHFKTTGSIEVWLFVTSERTKPFPVYPKDVKINPTLDKSDDDSL